jgi:hypothetical protein
MAYNAFLVASNATKTRLGATFADWTYFSPWFRASEDEKADKEQLEAE